ncbi:MAG: 6,7-dimethyl-8-ribityllumazine synthase [Candidatus Moranbacteria bacterium]|nr:6,7-dimethyl-8-ribityllumazine synthase [Candidatus Moranbacteria bacterium]
MAKNIAIILGSFHKNQVEEMLDEARKTATEFDLNIIEEIWVPGSYEKPLVLKSLLSRNDVAGAVVLGIIEKGETKHGLIMAQAVMGKILDLELEYMKPVGIGILGPEILPEQIPVRLRPYANAAIKATKKMLDIVM